MCPLGESLLVYIEKDILPVVGTLLSCFLSKRKYNTSENIKSINRILIPALVFFIELVIKLSPDLYILHNSEFCTGTYVHGALQLFGISIIILVPGAVKCKQITRNK